MFRIQRVYDQGETEGRRFLVDRLWPRGVAKKDLPLSGWAKDVAPSDALRKWLHADPARWSGFEPRYVAELEDHPDAWAPLLEAGRNGPVTLLFSAHDPERNNASVLKAFLERKLAGKGSGDAASSREAGRANAGARSDESEGATKPRARPKKRTTSKRRSTAKQRSTAKSRTTAKQRPTATRRSSATQRTTAKQRSTAKRRSTAKPSATTKPRTTTKQRLGSKQRSAAK